MLSLRGYSNGKYVIPADDVALPENAEVIIVFLDDLTEEKHSDLIWFKNLCTDLDAIKDELPAEYDKILSERMNFGRELEL
jgi:hypothetical protein